MQMRLIPRRRRNPDGSMTVVEHLEELRRRIFFALAAVLLASIFGFVFFDNIFDFLVKPYRRAVATLPPEARPESERLAALSPLEPFQTFLKVGLFTGLFIALPLVLHQVWRYVTPGLKQRERRLAAPFVVSSLVLFAGGFIFAYTILPRGLSFLFSFGSSNLVPVISVDRYVSFFMLVTLAFGLSFEFPLLMVFLAGAGVITTRQMQRWRRYVYFGITVFAALITPTQDPFTMLLMTAPLILFYEVAILVARFFRR